MTHRGPFQPLLFCDSVIPAEQLCEMHIKVCLASKSTGLAFPLKFNLALWVRGPQILAGLLDHTANHRYFSMINVPVLLKCL